MTFSKATIYSYILIILTSCLLPVNSLYSQGDKKIKAVINDAFNEVYSNPDKVISIGEKIINESGNNVDIKIRGYVLISDAYSAKRDYQKSLKYAIKANQLLSLTKDELLKISILNKIGIQYQQMKIYDKSIQYLDLAEQTIKTFPYKDSIHLSLGTNYIVKGFIYKEKQANDIAIDFFDRAVAELLKIKSKTAYGTISIAKYNKGNCYVTLKKDKLAIQNFIEAFEYARIVNAKSLQAFALKGKAQIYTYESNHSLAIKTLKEALFYASGVNDLILYREIYKGLSENYLAVDNLAEYGTYYSKYLEAKNEINNRERKSISDSLDEKTKELKANLEKKINTFYWLYSIILSVLILLIILLQIQTNKKQKKIETEKEEIELLLNKNKQ